MQNKMKNLKKFKSFENEDEIKKIKSLLFSTDEKNRELGITLYKSNSEYHSEEMNDIVWIMEHIIFVFANATAIIDSEFAFFKDCYKKLVKDNKELKNKDLFVFLRVEADFSSGNGIFVIEDGKPYKAADDDWDVIAELFESLNLSTTNDLKNCKSIKKYEVYL